MTADDEESRRRAEQARQTGLFRYRLVSEVTGPQLSARQRGQRVPELAAAAISANRMDSQTSNTQKPKPWYSAGVVLLTQSASRAADGRATGSHPVLAGLGRAWRAGTYSAIRCF